MGIFSALVVAGILYGLFGFFVSKSSAHTNAFLANAIFNTLGGLIPFAVFLFIYYRESLGRTAFIDKEGWIWNIAAGITIAVFSVLLVKIFARGGDLGYVLPVVYGIALVVGTLLGYFILHEKLAFLHIAGVMLIVFGVGCVAIAKS